MPIVLFNLKRKRLYTYYILKTILFIILFIREVFFFLNAILRRLRYKKLMTTSTGKIEEKNKTFKINYRIICTGETLLTCLTGRIWQPKSDVSAPRGADKHRFFEPDSFGASFVGRHPFGRFFNTVPSGLQHFSGLPLP